MILLLIFAFIAGIITILSPCILPILPIVLSSSVDNSGKRRPFGVVVGFVTSFTFFTLALSTIVKYSGIPADSLRLFSVAILVIFGLSLLIPRIQLWIEMGFSRLSRFAPTGQNQTGFVGGFIIGLSLGLLWTPCVGPILASVISLAITGTVTTQAIFITLAYAIGTAIPMFIIMQAGSNALQKVPWLVRNTAKIQRAFGVLMILTAVGIFFNVDRRFQTWILTTFPQYGIGLTQVEDNEQVRQALESSSKIPMNEDMLGRPSFDLQEKGTPAPEIIPGGAWFNSDPLTLADLKGKVVLIDFWTYSCINCQRTFPYLRTWWEKYEDDGLVIIGVHSPEFEFEKNPDNVQQAIEDFDLRYPIVQDNEFATWRAYNNRFWPAKYIIDKNGNIRYTHFGEGAYNETEEVIRQLLSEMGTEITDAEVFNPSYQIYARTPETYLGYLRIFNLGSPQGIKQDVQASYTFPTRLAENYYALDGDWTITPEYAAPQAGSELLLNFESKEVFLVARPKEGTASLKVFVDGEMQYFGVDNQNGTVTVDADALYRIINLPSPGRHELRLQFEDNNIEVYAFTFG